MPRPVERMEGETLSDGWVVGQPIVPSANATGGFFSVGYLAQHPDKGEAFLKALDFSDALASGDPVAELARLTQAYDYECQILDKCKESRMSRVIVAVEKGIHRFSGDVIPVPYLLFEKADGDVRAHLDAAARFETAWAFRMLHQVATGLTQLHGKGIAHQDMKPSNVLMFGSDSSKIADFGRSDYRGHAAPYSACVVAGDRGYAPLELAYGQVDPDWDVRRRACDAYHLGSLLLFFFTGTSTTPAILVKLDPAQQPRPAGGPSYASVLPFVRVAFNEVAVELGDDLDGEAADDVVQVFRELCEPDPSLRGHPKARLGLGSQFDLRRYVTKFDLLARKAEMGLVAAVGR